MNRIVKKKYKLQYNVTTIWSITWNSYRL